MNCCKLIESGGSPGRLRRAREAPGLLCALAVALATASAPPARAASPDPKAVAEARRSQAKRHFDEGVQAFGEHRYSDAVAAFLQADAVEPSPPLSFNIARAFEHLDKPADALRFYRDYLRRDPAAKNAAQVRARVDELAGVLAARGVQQLTVFSTPRGAAVTVDERTLGTTPLTTELAPGPHHVRLELGGYRAGQAEVEVAPRTPSDLVLTLQPLPASVAQTQEASHEAQETPRRIDRPGSSSLLRSAPWLVLGAGGASLLGALGFELARHSAESAARQSTQPDYPEHFQAMNSRQTTARVLAGAGGALLVTGGVWLLLTPRSRSGTRAELACEPSACRLVATGRFR